MSNVISELVPIPIAQTKRVDIYSGMVRMTGKIYGQLVRPADHKSETVIFLTHPASAFLDHYLLRPLAEKGVHAFGMNTRYVGNDSSLIMENILPDIASAFRVLQEKGYKRFILIGNSGGASLSCFYQAEAENPSVTMTPGGEPVEIGKLVPADALIILAAHSGRARVFTENLDPSITDERDPNSIDDALDMYNKKNGPPYSKQFLERYREAQFKRNRRITQWCKDQIAARKGLLPAGVNPGFMVHRTFAEPAYLDLSIEPTERGTCHTFGDPERYNLDGAGLGRYTTHHSWLSQWSYDESRADGVKQLPRTSVPVHVIQPTADEMVLPHHPQSLFDAVKHKNKIYTDVRGATHYPKPGTPALAAIVDTIVGWVKEKKLAA